MRYNLSQRARFARPFSAHRIAAANGLLAAAAPQDILRWAVSEFHPQLAMATAFGAEGCCLIHLLAEIEPGVRVFNLETGYQFPKTLALRDRLKERYGIDVQLVRPELTVAEYEAKHGGPLYCRRPDQCCHDRKLEPLRRAVAGYDAWVSAIRRDQSAFRALADVVQWDARFNLVKINPLLHWTQGDVWKFIVAHNVPYNPLHDRGYPSIGCWPCTRGAPAGTPGAWPST
jgi:phosphoadenosine phosphosulfate reductase